VPRLLASAGGGSNFGPVPESQVRPLLNGQRQTRFGLFRTSETDAFCRANRPFEPDPGSSR
jgi:hypothetical protein